MMMMMMRRRSKVSCYLIVRPPVSNRDDVNDDYDDA